MSAADTRAASESGSSTRASVLHGPKDLRIEARSLLPPKDNEITVAVRSTGLCGSDLHYYRHGRNGDIIMKEPMSLGHESAGIVTAVGKSVTHLKVGDKVALEVGQPCGQCDRCAEGRYNICKGMHFRASARSFPHAQGTLQERINQPAEWAYKLPDHVSLDLGALLEPMGVAIHATKRAQLKPRSTCLVFGAGAVGLLTAGMLKASGAGLVVIADIDEGRVKFAVDNNFADSAFAVPMKRGQTIEEQLDIAKETAAAIGEVEGKEGTVGEVDATFECTGVPSCLQAGIYVSCISHLG